MLLGHEFKVCSNPVDPGWLWTSAIKWTKIPSKTAGSLGKAALSGGAEFPGQSPSLTLASSQESLASMNAHSRSKIQGSFTSHCLGNGWGGTGLPGRLLDLNNKTPISPSETLENSLDFSYRRKELTSTHVMNRTVELFWHMRLAPVLKFLCRISHSW